MLPYLQWREKKWRVSNFETLPLDKVDERAIFLFDEEIEERMNPKDKNPTGTRF